MTVQELIDNLKTLPPHYKILVLSDACCNPENPSFFDLDYLEADNVDEDYETEKVWILSMKRKR